MGPLRLCDTVGLDICLAVAESLYAEFGAEAHYAPPVPAAWSTPATSAADRARVLRVLILTVVE